MCAKKTLSRSSLRIVLPVTTCILWGAIVFAQTTGSGDCPHRKAVKGHCDDAPSSGTACVDRHPPREDEYNCAGENNELVITTDDTQFLTTEAATGKRPVAISQTICFWRWTCWFDPALGRCDEKATEVNHEGPAWVLGTEGCPGY